MFIEQLERMALLPKTNAPTNVGYANRPVSGIHDFENDYLRWLPYVAGRDYQSMTDGYFGSWLASASR
jgi:hypothetical protein